MSHPVKFGMTDFDGKRHKIEGFFVESDIRILPLPEMPAPDAAGKLFDCEEPGCVGIKNHPGAHLLRSAPLAPAQPDMYDLAQCFMCGLWVVIAQPTDGRPMYLVEHAYGECDNTELAPEGCAPIFHSQKESYETWRDRTADWLGRCSHNMKIESRCPRCELEYADVMAGFS